MDMSLGVPTVWASRDTEDAVSAQTLVEMGFLMLAETWPVLSTRHSDSLHDLLDDVATNVECQMAEYEKMDRAIKKIEDTARSQMRQAEEMKKIRNTLVQNVTSFRTRHPVVSSPRLTKAALETNFWETDGQKLVAAVLEYKNGPKGRNGRNYPHELTDLSDHLPQEMMTTLRDVPDALATAVRMAKRQATDGKKRSSAAVAHCEDTNDNDCNTNDDVPNTRQKK
jgi:hypothetical protein